MEITPNTPRPIPASQEAHKIQKQTEARATHEVLKATVATLTESVSLSVKEQPLALVYRAAIEKLNEALEPTLGPNAIEAAAESELEFTPEATAQRIVDLSTGFFEAFKAQHPGEGDASVLDSFMETIRSGIDRGFEEARSILEGLQVLEGDIADNIDKTYALVQEGLDAFAEQMRQADEESS